MTRAETWSLPPATMSLAPGDVHVWRASLCQPAPRVAWFAHLLSDDERERAGRFFFEQDRRRFIVARGILRVLLSRYLGCNPSHLRFCYGEYGKPSLADMAPEHTLCFNMSHSHNLALYACAWNQAMGIDLERIRPVSDDERIVRRYFSAREYAVFQSLVPEQRQQAFFNGWTRKEAWLKARGVGLANHLGHVEVSLRPDEPAALLHIAGESCEDWYIQALSPARGYTAALVVQGKRCAVRCWQFYVNTSGHW